MNSQRPDERKRPYEKPSLRIIELAAEEIMGVCKTDAGSPGPLRFSCSFCSQQFGGS
jgi:hypothetical protein